MRKLFSLAIQKKKNIFLIGLAVFFMCLLTLASQLEIFALGVITKKGPSFFEVYGEIENGTIIPKKEVSFQEMTERWQQLDPENTMVVSEKSVEDFFKRYKGNDFIANSVDLLNKYIPLQNNLKYLALFMALIAIFKAITLFCHRFTTRVIAIRVSRDLRLAYFQHLQSLPMEFYHRFNIGSLSSRVVGDAVMIAEAVNSCLINYLQTPFAVLSTLILCFLTSWQLSLMIFLGFPLIVFPILLLARKVKRISKQIQKHQESFSSILLDFLNGIHTVKVFAMEEFSLKKYKEQNEKMAKLEQKSARYDLSSRPIIHTIAMLFLATALLCGLYVFQMNVAEVLMYCGLLYIFYEPIKRFAEENSHIQRGLAAAERMSEVLEIKSTIQDSKHAIDIREFNDAITFENVWFKYAEEWVLKGVSFSIKKGETIALVGATGSGKSTIVQLLPRLYDIQKGEIRIDGLPLQAYTQKSLRELFGFVPQKPFLFLDTVKENIAFGKKYTNAEIIEAAEKAYADEFIKQLPQGYDTFLAEGGKNLSGGQQQRLAIARALARKTPILVMDEATSALDSISEHAIKMALKQLKTKATQVIIAHRLSTIDYADRIIVLEKGEKIAEGTKEEVLAVCPIFKEMWEMQSIEKIPV